MREGKGQGTEPKKARNGEDKTVPLRVYVCVHDSERVVVVRVGCELFSVENVCRTTSKIISECISVPSHPPIPPTAAKPKQGHEKQE